MYIINIPVSRIIPLKEIYNMSEKSNQPEILIELNERFTLKPKSRLNIDPNNPPITLASITQVAQPTPQDEVKKDFD